MMSELSAKHKALNILRVLTTDKVSNTHQRLPRSPRPDLTTSQEVLAEKYRELATLLATQHVERKTVARLQSVDLVSRQVKQSPSPRRQQFHGNRIRRKRVTKSAPEVDSGPKIVELSSGDEEDNKNEFHASLTSDETSDAQPQRRKQVSFNEASLGNASSCSDVSDTEVIRSILLSPRKVLPGEGHVHPRPPVRTRKSTNKQTNPSKRKLRVKQKGNQSLKLSPQRSESPKRSLESAPIKKEFHSSDNKLSTSSNPDVLSWLKEKNKIIRKQKRVERKKERQEKLEEQKCQDEKLRKHAESEDKFSQWMKHKKEDSITKQRAERKIQRVVKQREALQNIEAVKQSNESLVAPTPLNATSESKSQTPSTSSPNKRKSSKPRKTARESKENVSDNQRRFDEDTRHHLVRNLESERLHDEEKRQRKEAEKRRKKLLREAQEAQASKKAAITSSKKTTSMLPSESKSGSISKPKTGSSNRKNMPSSNPFKGLTYDDWLKQKQTDQRKQAKESKKQEVGDPELDDLIPLLARRRIEQIKVRATRIDSGLRKSRNTTDLLENSNSQSPRTPNGVRPYTWNSPTSPNKNPKDMKQTNLPKNKQPAKSDPTTPTERVDCRKQKSAYAPMPDVVNFERPEPQGCEGTENTCQSPRTSQPHKTTVDPDTKQVRPVDLSDNNNDRRKQDTGKPAKINASSESDGIFMTDQNI